MSAIVASLGRRLAGVGWCLSSLLHRLHALRTAGIGRLDLGLVDHPTVALLRAVAGVGALARLHVYILARLRFQLIYIGGLGLIG